MTDGTLYFSRVRLRREPGSAGVLAALLTATGGAQGAHRLIWSLFAADGKTGREFLYREKRPGEFYALSARPPEDRHNLWHVETKEFAPVLRAGDRLGFSLRANPVVRRRPGGRAGKQRRHDVIMDRLKPLPKGDRSPARATAERDAGLAWLAARADRAGFAFSGDEVAVDGYLQHRVPRGPKADPLRFSSLDFNGVLSVTDVDRFRATLAEGLGPSKAYGCGLLLIRRA